MSNIEKFEKNRRLVSADELPVAELVDLIVRERGMSLAEIAGEIGVSRVSVWNWVKGRSLPRRERRAQLSAMLMRSHQNFDKADRPFGDVISDAKEVIANQLGIDADDVKIVIES